MLAASQELLCCPRCGEPLSVRLEEGQRIPFCLVCRKTFYPGTHIAVVAILTDMLSDHIILARRNRDPYKGKWAFPGGFVNHGKQEHPEHAMKRELQEELAITPQFMKYHSCAISTDDPRAPGHTILFYRCHVDDLSYRRNADTKENQAVKVFPCNAIPELAFAEHRKVWAMLNRDSGTH